MNLSSLGKTGSSIVALDLAAIVVVSIAMFWLIDQPGPMLAFVGLVTVLRLIVAGVFLPSALPVPIWSEIVFLGLCVLVGAMNDWNSVTNHRIYFYDSARIFPELTGVPEWMLLFWGLVLRFFADLSTWERLGEGRVSDKVHWFGHEIDSRKIKIVLMVILVIVTRQWIYRFYEEPVLSWVPFTLAIGAFIYFFRPGKIDGWMAVFFLISGPAVESFYINTVKLHHYYLPVIGGLPIWLILWWLLAMWIWSDITRRIFKVLSA